MRLDRIELQNFACFESASLDFAHRFNLIVGDNATGKTSWLNGIGVGIAAILPEQPFAAQPTGIRKDFAHARAIRLGDSITVERQYPVVVDCNGEFDGQPLQWCRDLLGEKSRTSSQYASEIRVLAGRLAKCVQQGEPVLLPVLSFYGTGRLHVQKKQRQISTLKPDSRFMGYLDCLDPASDAKRLLSWFKTQELVSLQQGKPISSLEACRTAILTCIPDATRVWFDVQQDALLLETADRIQPFSNLSDGFRNMLAMVADIAVRCATLNPHLGAEAALQTPGIVLIDEIDLHLHPKWQRRVVGDLLKAFPKIQFVATTHSPFIIQSLPPIDGVRLINLDAPGKDQPFANQSLDDIAADLQQRPHTYSPLQIS
jgi:predicted ATP-binding protein involved in virulence